MNDEINALFARYRLPEFQKFGLTKLWHSKSVSRELSDVGR
jgi:hypothetical protein